MAHWLLKTEPDCYAWEDLARDKKTSWDGITNALALKHLRTLRKGDSALIYHTGNVRAVVGVADVISDAHPDPNAANPKLVAVELRARRPLARPVTLSEFKADRAFDGWDLLRLSRLSVVPVPEAMWRRIEELSAQPE